MYSVFVSIKIFFTALNILQKLKKIILLILNNNNRNILFYIFIICLF